MKSPHPFWFLPFLLTAQPQPLTLQQALSTALQNYPSIRVSQERINAAAAAIDLAHTAYLPRLDAVAQANRATRNNIFGLLLPGTNLPSMSGPVIGTNNLGSVWGSAAGALVSWEPFDFGLRNASVQVAEASRAQGQATLKRTQFEVAATAADAYLTVIAAEETIRAAQAGVNRADALVKVITAQVNAELRPGADQSRAAAELAATRTQLIQAQQAAAISRANLAQFLGDDNAKLPLAAPAFRQLPPEAQTPEWNPSANPLLLEQNAAIEQAQAQLHVLERSYFPKFYLQGAAYARGSGAETNGARLGGLNGLAPNVQDYAVGFTVTFPVLDLAAIRARQAAQSATVRAETARSAQISLELHTQWNRAVATLDGARRIAQNTPIQVNAAQAAVRQATARYQAGLGNITEVADAERLLTQSEIDDAIARLNVWRALLTIATVAGDIQPFVAQASQ